ncbi:ABC transporter permease subunit [Streptomyces zaomyceticus]|uniref:ABC transporter permease subunit n=1 Tax=Streptomyces zaomyceticus TaxID=68286 RepID=UPI00324C0382
MTTTLDRAAHRSTRPARGGFGRLLHAEWTKFRTVRGWVLTTIGSALVICLVGLLATAAVHERGGDAPGALPVGPGGEAVNDSFTFVHQPLAGDGTLTVSVSSLTGEGEGESDDGGAGEGEASAKGGEGGKGGRSVLAPWAKAGIIVKDSLEQGSSYASVMVTGAHGVRMQYDFTHDTAGLPGEVSPESPRLLRLRRSGDVITGYQSVDGDHWTEVGTARLPGLSRTPQVGLFVTSPSVAEPTGTGTGFSPAVATGTFDTVSLEGGWSAGTWLTGQVGRDAGTSGSYTRSTSSEAVASGGDFTLTGAGDIAPVVGGPAASGVRTVENFLVGAFAGLIMLVVVAASYITAEYRRGLIAVTLAAGPGRSRVLVAKALVMGSVAFAAGLASAAVTVPFGGSRSSANGFPVLTVPTATELRVVMGTGLVLATTSVLALALGTVLRRSAVAITVVVVGMVLPYLLATAAILPEGASDWLLKVTPAAGFALQQSVERYDQVVSVYSPATGYHPLAPWEGFAVLCAYTALAFGAAVALLRRRDV